MGSMPPVGGPMGLNRPMTGPMGGSIGIDGVGRRQQHESFGALESSKLVQLDLLGLITIFTPPDNPLVADAPAEAEGQTEENIAADPESDDSDAVQVDAPIDSSEVESDVNDVEVDVTEGQEEIAPEQSVAPDDSEGTLDPVESLESETTPESDDLPTTEEPTLVE